MALLTARYIILCTRRLQPPHDDCAVRVQRFSSVFQCLMERCMWDFNLMRRLHYVPGSQGNHVLGHRGRNVGLENHVCCCLISQSIWCVGGQGGPSPLSHLANYNFLFIRMHICQSCISMRSENSMCPDSHKP